MKRSRTWRFGCLGILAVSSLLGDVSACGDEPAKITFEDHIKPIFREHCSSCHNNNAKKGGLSLESYSATMAGGSSGEVLVAGDLDSSRLYALTAHKEQPVMPPMQDKIAQAKIDLLKTWIEQGMPENSGSAIRKVTANASMLSVAATGRPEGPPPMPTSMLKQTPLYTPKSAAVAALAASPWSPLVAVGGQMQVALYHSQTGELLGILPFPEGEPQSITFSRDGRLILVGGGRHSVNGIAALYDVATGNRIAKVGDELDIVLAADISDDNQWIALAGPQKLVRVYNTLTGELKWEQKKHTDWIYALRFSPDGLLLATADRAAGLVIWETVTGRMYADLPGHKSEIRGLSWRPDSGAVVTASLDGTLKLWDMNESKLLRSWDAHGGGAAAVAVCNDGTMVSTGKDNKVRVWDAGGNAAGEMPALAEAGQEVAITVDGTHVVAGDWAGNVRIWTRANPAEEKRLAPNPPTLEMAIATQKQHHDASMTELQTASNEWTTLKTQSESLQKQIADQQTAIASILQQIQAITTVVNERKAELEKQTNAMNVKQVEAAGLVQSIDVKTAAQAQSIAERKTTDELVVALQKQRETATEGLEALDQQIASALKSAVEKADSVAKITTELNALTSDKAQRDKELAEIAVTINVVTQEINASTAKLNELATNKTNADTQLDAWVKESAAVAERLAAAQAKRDGVQAQVTANATKLQQLESDLVRFQGMIASMDAKRGELDQAIASTTNERGQVEGVLNQTKQTMAAADQTLAGLEQQLAELQSKVNAAKESRQNVASQVAAQQQQVDGFLAKLQQLQGEIDTLTAQQKLFLEAYKPQR